MQTHLTVVAYDLETLRVKDIIDTGSTIHQMEWIEKVDRINGDDVVVRGEWIIACDCNTSYFHTTGGGATTLGGRTFYRHQNSIYGYEQGDWLLSDRFNLNWVYRKTGNDYYKETTFDNTTSELSTLFGVSIQVVGGNVNHCDVSIDILATTPGTFFNASSLWSGNLKKRYGLLAMTEDFMFVRGVETDTPVYSFTRTADDGYILCTGAIYPQVNRYEVNKPSTYPRTIELFLEPRKGNGAESYYIEIPDTGQYIFNCEELEIDPTGPEIQAATESLVLTLNMTGDLTPITKVDYAISSSGDAYDDRLIDPTINYLDQTRADPTVIGYRVNEDFQEKKTFQAPKRMVKNLSRTSNKHTAIELDSGNIVFAESLGACDLYLKDARGRQVGANPNLESSWRYGPMSINQQLGYLNKPNFDFNFIGQNESSRVSFWGFKTPEQVQLQRNLKRLPHQVNPAAEPYSEEWVLGFNPVDANDNLAYFQAKGKVNMPGVGEVEWPRVLATGTSKFKVCYDGLYTNWITLNNPTGLRKKWKNGFFPLPVSEGESITYEEIQNFFQPFIDEMATIGLTLKVIPQNGSAGALVNALGEVFWYSVIADGDEATEANDFYNTVTVYFFGCRFAVEEEIPEDSIIFLETAAHKQSLDFLKGDNAGLMNYLGELSYATTADQFNWRAVNPPNLAANYFPQATVNQTPRTKVRGVLTDPYKGVYAIDSGAMTKWPLQTLHEYDPETEPVSNQFPGTSQFTKFFNLKPTKILKAGRLGSVFGFGGSVQEVPLPAVIDRPVDQSIIPFPYSASLKRQHMTTYYNSLSYGNVGASQAANLLTREEVPPSKHLAIYMSDEGKIYTRGPFSYDPTWGHWSFQGTANQLIQIQKNGDDEWECITAHDSDGLTVIYFDKETGGFWCWEKRDNTYYLLKLNDELREQWAVDVGEKVPRVGCKLKSGNFATFSGGIGQYYIEYNGDGGVLRSINLKDNEIFTKDRFMFPPTASPPTSDPPTPPFTGSENLTDPFKFQGNGLVEHGGRLYLYGSRIQNRNSSDSGNLATIQGRNTHVRCTYRDGKSY